MDLFVDHLSVLFVHFGNIEGIGARPLVQHHVRRAFFLRQYSSTPRASPLFVIPFQLVEYSIAWRTNPFSSSSLNFFCDVPTTKLYLSTILLVFWAVLHRICQKASRYTLSKPSKPQATLLTAFSESWNMENREQQNWNLQPIPNTAITKGI